MASKDKVEHLDRAEREGRGSEYVNPIENAQDIIDIVRHALDWITLDVDEDSKQIVTADILAAELESILEWFAVSSS